MPEPMPYYAPIPVQSGGYLNIMPQGDAIGIFLILMVFVTMIFLIPIILFLVMMYKARRNVADWQDIFSSDDVKKQMEKSNERVNSFVDKIDELFDLWIERERKKK